VGHEHAPTETFPASAPAAAAEPDIAIGARIGKYEVKRVVGAGGAGVVLAARDEELGRDVAIKFLVRDSDEARARLLREAKAMAQLSHPNVVTVHEVLRLGERTGIVMALVDGRDLNEWHTPERGWRETVAAYVQAARGLAAAHRAGIVHRDFKPSNALIDRDGIVRVTDFGLARTTDAPELAAGSGELGDEGELTQTGVVVGTPAYMAPEQHAGRGADERTDQWALACSLYGALYDQKPFAGDKPSELRASVLEGKLRPEPARSPVPKRIRAAVRRALAHDADDRFASMDELIAALEAPRRTRIALIAGAAVLAAAAAVTVVVGMRSPPPAHRVVAVLGFKNVTGRADVAWLATGLSEMFASELAGDALRIVPSESIARATLELHLEPGTLASDTLAKVRADLGADLVVGGSYVVEGDGQLRVDVALQDARSGETTVVPAVGTTRELLPLVTEAGGRLRRALGVSGVHASSAAAALPADPALARQYLDGLAAMRRFDPLAALPQLQAVARAAPDFPLAHVALAQVLDEVGDRDAAAAAARAALDHADRLPERESHVVKARYFEVTREWAKAIDEYRWLTRIDPDDIEYGLGLANVLARSQSYDAAYATLDQLRLTSHGRDPRIDLGVARAADLQNNFRREQVAAAEAARRGREIGAELLVANAQLDEAWASRRLGDDAHADRVRAEALATFERLGYRQGMGSVHGQLSTVLLDKGDLVGAHREAETALALFVAVGDRESQHTAWMNVAESLQDLGDLAGARTAYEKSLALARETHNKNSEAGALLNLGFVAIHQGDVAAARPLTEQARPTFHANGNGYAEALCLAVLAFCDRVDGDLAAARSRLSEAYAMLRTVGDRRDAASIQVDLARIARITGDPAGARRLVDEARREAVTLQLDAVLADSDLELARIELDGGKYADAARDARASVERFAKDRQVDEEARSRAYLATALALDHNASEAAAAIVPAVERAKASQDGLLRIEVAIAAARVDAANGNPRGLEQLRAIGSAKETPIEKRLEAQLAAAQLTGAPAALAQVARDAAAAGFATIADAARRR
jgi:eukaryotic-like serine/threonine-protein kinase